MEINKRAIDDAMQADMRRWLRLPARSARQP